MTYFWSNSTVIRPLKQIVHLIMLHNADVQGRNIIQLFL